ncbi:hypothetical protein [Nocardia aurantia]|uniref:Uncharacterized protein n=1 Tax=Nocardia aurantia TaxID=2585199 RepID=A0A7K0DQ04_9NOCA|nr:hypothetical protein [Nocardia aurantia]MQY27452.1 hypothetical protein [Nocardia aurantia]
MTQTTVAVYAVGEGGATGQRLGAATLVDPEYALVDPPLNRQLANDFPALRAGVFAAAEGVAEVIDIAHIHVIPEAPELVLLQLVSASAAPARDMPIVPGRNEGGVPSPEPTRAEVIAALRLVLADAPPPPPAGSPVSFVNDPIRWLLHLFGND